MLSTTLKTLALSVAVLFGATACGQRVPVKDYRDMDTQSTTMDENTEQKQFEVIMEAPLPEGFPGPGPVAKVVEKEYPVSRIVVAESEPNRAFMRLFRHIQKNEVAMTTPVEMEIAEEDPQGRRGFRMESMGFFYEGPQQGEAGEGDTVEVKDYPKMRVVSIGMAGEPNKNLLEESRAKIEAYMKDNNLSPIGNYRIMGYNSPFVPRSQKFFEMQVEVKPWKMAETIDAGDDVAEVPAEDNTEADNAAE